MNCFYLPNIIYLFWPVYKKYENSKRCFAGSIRSSVWGIKDIKLCVIHLYVTADKSQKLIIKETSIFRVNMKVNMPFILNFRESYLKLIIYSFSMAIFIVVCSIILYPKKKYENFYLLAIGALKLIQNFFYVPAMSQACNLFIRNESWLNNTRLTN